MQRRSLSAWPLFSTTLLGFLFVHAVFTGGFSFNDPVELFCLRPGFLSAFVGLAASVAGKGRLLPHVATISVINMLLCVIGLLGE